MTEDQTTPAPETPETPFDAPAFGAPAPETPETTAAETADGPTRTEEFTISANKLLGKVKELIAEGNVRRIIIRNESGKSLFEIPLHAGIAATAAGAIFAPVLVAVGAVAALLTSVSVTVVRDGEAPAKAEDADSSL